MKHTKDHSSPATKRAPFEPVKQLEQVPIALYESLHLARKGKEDHGCIECEQLIPLLKSTIEIALADPDGVSKLAEIWQEAA
jgi:hypothetical protein